MHHLSSFKGFSSFSSSCAMNCVRSHARLPQGFGVLHIKIIVLSLSHLFQSYPISIIRKAKIRISVQTKGHNNQLLWICFNVHLGESWNGAYSEPSWCNYFSLEIGSRGIVHQGTSSSLRKICGAKKKERLQNCDKSYCMSTISMKYSYMIFRDMQCQLYTFWRGALNQLW